MVRTHAKAAYLSWIPEPTELWLATCRAHLQGPCETLAGTDMTNMFDGFRDL